MENIVLKHLIIQSYCAKPPAECAFSWQQLLKSIHKACYGSVPSSMLSEHLQEGHNGLSAWISGFRRTSQSRLNPHLGIGGIGEKMVEWRKEG